IPDKTPPGPAVSREMDPSGTRPKWRTCWIQPVMHSIISEKIVPSEGQTHINESGTAYVQKYAGALMELPRSSDHANQREADKVQFIAALGWVAPARKLIGPQRRAPSPGPMALGRGLDGHGALADERDRHRVGHAVACGAEGSVGGAQDERGRVERLPLPSRHAISRARLFLDLADECTMGQRDRCEALMEAAIVFCRAAL